MAYTPVTVEVWDTVEGFPKLTAHVRLTHFPDIETFRQVIDWETVSRDEIRMAHEQVQINVYVRDDSNPTGRRRLSLGLTGNWLPAFKSDAAKLYAYEAAAIEREWQAMVDNITLSQEELG